MDAVCGGSVVARRDCQSLGVAITSGACPASRREIVGKGSPGTGRASVDRRVARAEDHRGDAVVAGAHDLHGRRTAGSQVDRGAGLPEQ